MAGRAPDDVQRIVRAVLANGVSNCIRLEAEPLQNVKKLLRNGQKASTAVRDLLRDHGGDVFTADIDEDCRFYARALYFMTPEKTENRVRKVMYVKFAIQVDKVDEALSELTIIRFHPAIGRESITRFS